MAADAGYALSFDIITKERMVAVSIAAHGGDNSGVGRMFDEVLDAWHGLAAFRQKG